MRYVNIQVSTVRFSCTSVTPGRKGASSATASIKSKGRTAGKDKVEKGGDDTGGKRTASPRRCDSVSSVATTDDGGEMESGDNRFAFTEKDGDIRDDSKGRCDIMDRGDVSCRGGESMPQSVSCGVVKGSMSSGADLATALSWKGSTQARSKAISTPSRRNGEDSIVGNFSGVASNGNQKRRRGRPRLGSKRVGETAIEYETPATADTADIDGDVRGVTEKETAEVSDTDGGPFGIASNGNRKRRRGRFCRGSKGKGKTAIGYDTPVTADMAPIDDDTRGGTEKETTAANDPDGGPFGTSSTGNQKRRRCRPRRGSKDVGETAIGRETPVPGDMATIDDDARGVTEKETTAVNDTDGGPFGTASKGKQQRRRGRSLCDSDGVAETAIGSALPAAAGMATSTTADGAHGTAENEATTVNGTGGHASRLKSKGHQQRRRGRPRLDGKAAGGAAIESAQPAVADTAKTAADDIRRVAESDMPAVNDTIGRDDTLRGDGGRGVPQTSEEWICSACTLINHARDVRCQVCGEYRPPDKRSLRSKLYTPTRFLDAQTRQRFPSQQRRHSPVRPQSQQERGREVDRSTASRVAHERRGAKANGRGRGSKSSGESGARGVSTSKDDSEIRSKDATGHVTTRGGNFARELSDSEHQKEKRTKTSTIAKRPGAGKPSGLPTSTAQNRKALSVTANDDGVAAAGRDGRVGDLTPNEISSSPGRSGGTKNSNGKAFPDNDSDNSSSTMNGQGVGTRLNATRCEDLDRGGGKAARYGAVANATDFAASAAASAASTAAFMVAPAAPATVTAAAAKHRDAGVRPSLGGASSGQRSDTIVQAFDSCSKNNDRAEDTESERGDEEEEVRAAKRWCAWAEAKDDISSPVGEDRLTIDKQFGGEAYDAVDLCSAFSSRHDAMREKCKVSDGDNEGIPMGVAGRAFETGHLIIRMNRAYYSTRVEL